LIHFVQNSVNFRRGIVAAQKVLAELSLDGPEQRGGDFGFWEIPSSRTREGVRAAFTSRAWRLEETQLNKHEGDTI
jgi:hypothetical protein